MVNTDQDKTAERVAGFLAACREHGIKATHQRVEIMRELASTVEHPDAEFVYKHVRARIPTISLDTVYRTLRLLEDNNIIFRVGSTKGRARFDANPDRHHHFVCSACGLVRDFHNEEFDHFPPPSEVAAIGSVDAVHIEMRGRCRQCNEKSANMDPSRRGKE
jgi:Fur family peroxide stress response transcriptional regulator